MHPPHFSNPWVIVYLIYGYPIFLMMLFNHYVGACSLLGKRRISLKEWVRGSR